MPIEVTDDLLKAITTKDKALADGKALSRKNAFLNTKRTDDNSLIWGQCQGSGKNPYEISVDLSGDKPLLRCTCPVKPPPCKHILGFLAHFMDKASAFSVGEPPAELMEKRTKAAERAEKPKKVDEKALEKKTKVQRDALDLLETLVLDLSGRGLGALDAKAASKIADQAKQMNDAYLKGAAVALKRIAGLATQKRVADDDDDDVYYAFREPGFDLPEEERQRLMVRHLARLWAMVRKGKKYLDDKLDEGESQGDADAVMEELLGRDWKLDELKQRGHTKQGLNIIELAYERYDDQVRYERIEQGFFVDLTDGAVYANRSLRPLNILDKVKGVDSYEKVLTLSDAAIYPGFVNRRIRWELSAFKARPVQPADYDALHKVALPAFDAAIARYKEQIKNPLAPDDAVLLLRIKDIVNTPAGVTLVDEKGARLLVDDSPLTVARTTNNLVMAAGSLLLKGALRQPASILTRIWLRLSDNTIAAEPLALVVGNAHLRLGM
jgi:hypothetical protein